MPVFEPVAQWQDVGGGHNLLQKFYEDTPRWAYTFQTYAFVTRVVGQTMRKTADPEQVQILERSVYSDRYVFAKNCFEMGLMSELEWQLYQEWFSWLVDHYTQRPIGFIYLQTKPETCQFRTRKRDRSEDTAVPLHYLERLHAKHEQWLVHKEGVTSWLAEIPVVVLPCDKDFEHDIAEQQRHVAAIAQAFNLPYKQPVPVQQPSVSSELMSGLL